MSPQKRRKVPFQTIPAAEKIANHRTPVPMLDLELRKTTFIPVELGYSEDQAQKKPALPALRRLHPLRHL